MDQTKFDVYQSVLQVVADLHLPEFLRATRGGQFTVSLKALRPNGEISPIDIYVDRASPGQSSRKYETPDEAQVLGATASIDPDGERFNLDIIVEKGAVQPFIRVSRNMLRLLAERQALRMDNAIQQIIKEADEPAE